MCLIIFGWDCHPRFKLVVAANRDEFYQRPTAPAGVWEDFPDTVAGRDLQAGGTWMGVNRRGTWAALTNYRDPLNHKHQAPSRGLLVQNYLTGELSPQRYLETVQKSGQEYNSFNLLLGNYSQLFYYSNREDAIRRIEPGIHGLSNSLLDVSWPKVVKGQEALKQIIAGADIEADSLFEMMRDQTQPADENLPDTGVGMEMERMLSPMFVSSEQYNYGTRVTTVLLLDRHNGMRLWERTYTPLLADQWEEVYFEIPSPDRSGRLSDLPNIGKTMEKRLASVGIEDIPTLIDLGSQEAFIRLRQHEGDT